MSIYIQVYKAMTIQAQMKTGLVLFFANAYICARYAIGIEHPFRWYRATRMKNYLGEDIANDGSRP